MLSSVLALKQVHEFVARTEISISQILKHTDLQIYFIQLVQNARNILILFQQEQIALRYAIFGKFLLPKMIVVFPSAKFLPPRRNFLRLPAS